jgi:CheY-like chemotaxis protein
MKEMTHVHEHCSSILVVEDDEAIRESLKDILEQEGYSVLTADNGQSGLEVLQSKPSLCLIILDLFMPIMNGVDFLEALRQKNVSFLSEFSILILSASPPDSEMSLKVKSLAKGFIKKPVDLSFFLGLVSKYC